MSFVCQFCSLACRSQRGLTQHTNRNEQCKGQQEALLGVRGGFRAPAGSTTTTKRRSNRNQKPHSTKKTAGYQLEVPDVDVGSLVASEAEDIESDADDDFPAADDSIFGSAEGDSEANTADSEAETSESRDDPHSNDDESSENEADSRDSESPNTDMVADFIKYCSEHPKNYEELTDEAAKSVKLMELLRKSKSPMGSFQPMLEWHLQETGHLEHWQTLKDTPTYVTRETLMKRLSKR